MCVCVCLCVCVGAGNMCTRTNTQQQCGKVSGAPTLDLLSDILVPLIFVIVIFLCVVTTKTVVRTACTTCKDEEDEEVCVCVCVCAEQRGRRMQ